MHQPIITVAAALIIRRLPKLVDDIIEQRIGVPAKERAFFDALVRRESDRLTDLFSK